jgi:hypothetical protein
VQYATWRDINLKNLRYTVTGEGKSDVAFVPKNHEERSVPLTTESGALVAEHKKRAISERWVFTNADGKPESHFLRKFKSIAKRAGLNCGQCKAMIRGGCYDNRHEVEVTCRTRPICDENYLHRLRETAAANWLPSGFDLIKSRTDWGTNHWRSHRFISTPKCMTQKHKRNSTAPVSSDPNDGASWQLQHSRNAWINVKTGP